MASTPNYPAGFANLFLDNSGTTTRTDTVSFSANTLLTSIEARVFYSTDSIGDTATFSFKVNDGTNDVVLATYTMSNGLGSPQTNKVTLSLSPAASGDLTVAYSATVTDSGAPATTETILVTKMPLAFVSGGSFSIDITDNASGGGSADNIDTSISLVGLTY